MCRLPARLLLLGASISLGHLAFANQLCGQAVTYQGVDRYTVQGLANSVDGSFDIGTGYRESAFGGQVVGGNSGHALLWDHKGTPTDLHPAALGFRESVTYGTNGQQQVGVVFNDANGHAVLWNGTAASAVDLNPIGYASSSAFGTNGTQQVGVGAGTPTLYMDGAMLWNGTAQSAVSLHPTNLSGFNTVSAAFGTNGRNQVGWGERNVAGVPRQHALLWSGTAKSAVDLNGSFFDSIAFAISPDGTQQVGRGDALNGIHALLWTGSAASGVDLTPATSPDTFTAEAAATNGRQQVGTYADRATADKFHAAVWSGTPESMIDLQPMLPSNLVSSRAEGIDSVGDIFGLAVDTAGNPHAVEWVLIPEPTTLANLALAGLLLHRRRRLNPAIH